jgi:hypothetical protein
MTSINPAPAMARRIEVWPTGRLVPYARNARTHSSEVAQIAASIAQFGFNAPILVDSNAGIVAGHGRLLAARKLGLPEVPVVVLDHLSETQRRAYIIADNTLALNAGWDEKILAAELRDLEDEGMDLTLVSFSDDELEDLLAAGEPEPSSDVDEEIPEEPVNPVTRPGDLWTIGPHRVICGDCRDAATVQNLLGGARANVCITSPPYATQREYDSASGFKPVPPDEYVAWYADVAANIAAVVAEGGADRGFDLELGSTNPILVRQDGVIIAGHAPGCRKETQDGRGAGHHPGPSHRDARALSCSLTSKDDHLTMGQAGSPSNPS